MWLPVTGWITRTIECREMLVFRVPSEIAGAWPKAFLAAAACALICLLSLSARGQQEEPIERLTIETKLVSVPVIVSDRSGHYIPGLRVQNFKLYDNNVEQKISFFDAAEEPLNVVLLLDTSRSTRGVLGDIKNAARDFLRALRPRDRAMIVSFDKDVEQLSPLTSDREVLERAIKRTAVSQYFGTLLYDAVLQTSKSFLQPVTGRKAIILLTDGEDGGSQLGAKELLAYESEVDAMIYPIYYESFLNTGGSGGFLSRLRGIFGGTEQKSPQQKERAAAAVSFLTNLSDVTGGHFFSSNATDLKNAFDLVARELRYQYRLGFYPAEVARDGSLRTLKVRVDRPDVAVRARRQYRTK
jgi:VWFA-related protein